MIKHFNQLTPAEAERLAILAEEAAEVAQIAMKVLRHGYESCHPDSPGWTNRMQLSKEVADFNAIVTLMDDDFDPTVCDDAQETIARKLPWTHHQETDNDT